MATGTAGDQARQGHRQYAHTIRAQINFNDAGIAAGKAIGMIPQGAFIMRALVEIVTAFNAGTTNVLTIGTDSGVTDMVNGGDVNEGATGVTDVTRGVGRGIAALASKTISAKYTNTGTAPTAGQAEIVIEYEANLG